MSQSNQRGLRDPIWQFIWGAISVILAIIAIFVTIHFATPHASPTPKGTPQATHRTTPTAPTATMPPTSTLSPTPLVTPTTSATDWGVLDGDAITVNKSMPVMSGYPDPLHVEVQTIQIDKGNNMTTFTVYYFATVNNIAAGTVSFSGFSLQSDVTPETQASQTAMNSTQTVIAKFPFAPVNNDMYTLSVSAQYQTINDGLVSITPVTINFEGVQMSFNS